MWLMWLMYRGREKLLALEYFETILLGS